MPSNSSNSTSGASSGLGATGNGGAFGTNAVADALSTSPAQAAVVVAASQLKYYHHPSFSSLYTYPPLPGINPARIRTTALWGIAFGGDTYLRTSTESHRIKCASRPNLFGLVNTTLAFESS